jgi:hypothetical protein
MRTFVQQKSSEPSLQLLVSNEMEFLDINLTKDPGLLRYAIHSPFFLADFTENHTLPWFLKSIKKSAEQKKLLVK